MWDNKPAKVRVFIDQRSESGQSQVRPSWLSSRRRIGLISGKPTVGVIRKIPVGLGAPTGQAIG